MPKIEHLTMPEQMALAGLMRMIVRLDGRLTDDEQRAIASVAAQVTLDTDTPGAGPFRDASSIEPLGEVRFLELIQIAGEEFPDDAAVREAVLEVKRTEAREAIFAFIYEVAAANGVTKGENKLLDWLTEHWELQVSTVADDGAGS